MLKDARTILGGDVRSFAVETGATSSLRALARERRIAPTIRAGQDLLFRSLWASDIPIVVKEATSSMQCSWSPQEFVKSHGDEPVKMIKTSGPSTVNVTVSKFFEEFMKEDGGRGFSVKIKAKKIYFRVTIYIDILCSLSRTGRPRPLSRSTSGDTMMHL